MKVYFFQDNSFFRTKEGTNPFFDPIIHVCEENGIEWKVWTNEPSEKCGYSVEKMRYFSRFNKISVFFCRIARLILRMDARCCEYLFGRFMRPFYGRELTADLYITIAGNQCVALSGMFPNARNVDIQHGVIHSRHKGYFSEDCRLRSLYQELKNREFWLYGKGYADCFFKHPDNAKDLEGRVKVIGDVVRADKANKLELGVGVGERNVIAFSSQLTADLPPDVLKVMVERTVKFFEEKHAQYGDKYRYVIKQHPRFNDVCDISALEALPYLEHSSVPWSELFPKMKLHATFSSTVCFDAASAGVPTEFVPYPENRILDGRFYIDDFSYPETDQSPVAIRAWYESCYTPFSKENCKKLLGLVS